MAPTAAAGVNGTQVVPLNTSTTKTGAGVDAGLTDTVAEVTVSQVNGLLAAGGGLEGSSSSKLDTGRLPWLVACNVKLMVWPGTRSPPVGGLDELFAPPTEMSGSWMASDPHPVPVAAPLLPPEILPSLQSVTGWPPTAVGLSTA